MLTVSFKYNDNFAAGNNVNETARKIMRCYLKRPDVVTMLVNVRYSR